MTHLKQIIILITTLLCTCTVFAQQQGINYKALIKDANGNVLANTSIRIQFNIQYEPQGFIIVYAEEHLVDTDANGIVIANIGTGTQTSEDDPFSEIDWSAEAYYLNVEVDISGGTNYVDMGTTQFMAVPYAKYANTATNVLNGVKRINDLSDGRSDNDGTENGSSLFLGVDAGANDDGTDNKNVGIGYQALTSNTNGVFNTANGYQALSSNITGNKNTANGYQALYSNNGSENDSFRGDDNTANGFQALYSNELGYNNTANGSSALRDNTSGVANTANGNSALRDNTTGNSNTANGFAALLRNQTGDGNVALGYGAGAYETASNKLYIANSDTTTPLIYGEFDTNKLTINGQTTVNDASSSISDHAIKGIKTHTGDLDAAGVYGANTVSDFYGYGVYGLGGFLGVYGRVEPTGPDLYYGVSGGVSGGSGTNYGVFGTASGSGINYAMYADGNLNVTGAFTNPSDRKLKTNIQPLQLALTTISQLKASTYTIKPEYVKSMHMPTTPQYGFVAQELQEVLPDLVSVNKHPGERKEDPSIEYLGINYMALIPILTKGIQEQQEQIKSLEEKVNLLIQRIEALENN